MTQSRKPRPLGVLFLVLLVAGVVAAAAFAFLMVGNRTADSADSSAATQSTEAAEALEFSSRFVRLDGTDAFDQQIQLGSQSLRELYLKADALDRQRTAQPNPDAADLNPEHAPMQEKPAMAERSTWIFGLADAWTPGPVRLHSVEATRAEVDVDLQVVQGPVVTDRLLLVREEGSWRVDDVLHGPAGRDGSLRQSLAEVR